jgi:hypothetical protein
VTLDQFAQKSGLRDLSEVERVCHFAFFFFKTEKKDEFFLPEATGWLTGYGFASPNQTRLRDRLQASRNTVRGQRGGFKLQLDYVKEMEAKYPELNEKSQEVVEHGTILPEVDYQKTRGYIESLARQINAAYEHNVFDACAVLMRRLVEVLLILSYRHLGIESEVQDTAGNYQMLEGIINNAKTNAKLALSRNSKTSLDVFRQLGNFSAHKIEYTCRREYIQPHIQEYRALIVELLHKAGIRT